MSLINDYKNKRQAELIEYCKSLLEKCKNECVEINNGVYLITADELRVLYARDLEDCECDEERTAHKETQENPDDSGYWTHTNDGRVASCDLNDLIYMFNE